MATDTEFDVIIVGMGPVGALAALLLGESGVRTAVVERDREVYRLPRAVNLDGEIIRALQRIGRGETVNQLMQQVRPGERAGFADSRRQWLFGTEAKAFGVNGWQPMNMFDQPELETYLREEAMQQENVTAYIGYEAELLRHASVNANDAVEVSLSASGQNQTATLRARYLIACDGASSGIRKQLGIGWESLGYDHDWLVVDVTTRPGHTLDNDTVQVCDPQRLSTYVCTKDPYRRWEFRLNDGETAQQMLQEETIRSLIDPWTPRDTYEIRRAAVYQFHAATAERWRVDNVFLAGDAAHQTPPFLGQGMNAGMRDAINLAWKLEFVINGFATDALLDTYESERDAHARDLVEWAVSIGRLMEHLAEVERAGNLGEPPPDTPPALHSAGYGQGREQPPLRAGMVMTSQVSDDDSTGNLLSQPMISDHGGEPIRMDELLGPGFALIVTNRDGVEMVEMNDASRRILDRIGARIVSLAGLQSVRGHLDRVFNEHEAALIRPDRIVFGHSTASLNVDGLVSELARHLNLIEPDATATR